MSANAAGFCKVSGQENKVNKERNELLRSAHRGLAAFRLMTAKASANEDVRKLCSTFCIIHVSLHNRAYE